MTETTTVDVADRVDEIQEAIDELSGELGRIETEAADIEAEIESIEARLDSEGSDADDDHDQDDLEERLESLREEYDDLEEEYRQVKSEEKELEHARDWTQETLEEWGGSEFTIQKFDAGRQGQRNDLLRGDMLQNEYDQPEANASANRLRTVQVGVVGTPPNCDDAPAEFPPPIFDELHQAVENFNSYGDPDMDVSDFSLSTTRSKNDSSSS